MHDIYCSAYFFFTTKPKTISAVNHKLNPSKPQIRKKKRYIIQSG